MYHEGYECHFNHTSSNYRNLEKIINQNRSTLFWRIVLLFNPVELLGLLCMGSFECSAVEQMKYPVFRVLKTNHIVVKPSVESQLIIGYSFIT